MKPIPKSLHTVTSVSRVAAHLIEMHPANLSVVRGVSRALMVLGYPKLSALDNELIDRCLDATHKLVDKK